MSHTCKPRDDDLAQARRIFMEECLDGLKGMETGLLRLEGGGGHAPLLHELFRQAHSIKGGAASFGYDEIADFTHRLESMLDRIRAGDLSITPPLIQLLLESVNCVRGMMRAREGGNADSREAVRISHRLQQWKDAAPVPQPGSRSSSDAMAWRPRWIVRFAPRRHLRGLHEHCGGMRSHLARRLGQVRLYPRLAQIPELEALDPRSLYLSWDVEWLDPPERDRARSLLAAVARDWALEPGAFSLRDGAARSAVGGAGPGLAAEDQREVAAPRQHALPVRCGVAFSRFPRVVQEMSARLDKCVALELSGADTCLDRAMLETVNASLLHLVRNAVHHGIETPRARLAAGKPAAGTVCLSAQRRSGAVVLRVSDDGAGLDTDRIRARALEQGWIGAADRLSEHALRQLIFRPGFSTASQVSELAGRGVGLDVVRSKVAALGGRVALRCVRGAGSVFTITLPDHAQGDTRVSRSAERRESMHHYTDTDTDTDKEARPPLRTFTLPGALDLDNISASHGQCLALLNRLGATLTLDCGQVAVVDSAGVQLLSSLLKTLQRRGCEPRWDNFSVQLYQAAAELGMEQEFSG